MNKKLSIIIVTYNSSRFVNNLFSSLVHQLFKNFNIYIIDNWSKDNCLEQIESYKNRLDISIIKNPKNDWFAKANNIGIQKALEYWSDAVLLLNHDTVLEKDTLSSCMDFLFSNNKIWAIVPTILYWKPNQDKIRWVWSKLRSLKQMIIEKTFKIWYHIDKDKKYTKKDFPSSEVDILTWCAMFIKSGVVKEVWMLNEKYFMYFEDVERSINIKKKYNLWHFWWTVVYHDTEFSTKDSLLISIKNIKKYIIYIKSLLIFIFSAMHEK